ncbi:MAG: vanadium-dependent haloperoxidase, partial [Blastocatellia bacterium]|nr:vanadium-dependent haloperoxidase [Blastocatellia bacterium]
ASGNPSDFEQIPLGGTTRLANPQGGFAFNLEGIDSHLITAVPPPGFAEEGFAAEVTECYWLALTRDVPFSRYGKEPLTAAALKDLRGFSDFANLTADNLFRADIPGVQVGPYISQFLLQPYVLGSTPVEQRYITPLPGLDHLTSYQSWLDIQNGMPATSTQLFADTPTYIYNGRVLSEWVHRNFPYQSALIAALILMGYGNAALDDSNPYKGASTQSGFITFGLPHVLDMIARVANHALKSTWFQKWAVHRRMRPEEVGGRIHNHMTGAAQYPINSKLLDSPALASVFSRFGTFLCPQAFPEGCPAHPAFPGGNSTFNAAGITVLKAFFNESFVIPNPVVPSDDGLSLLPWKGEPLTVGNELNKLAFNAAFGRNTAGIHFRRDELQGILFGEASALSVMTDLNSTYNESFSGFGVTTFDGSAMSLSTNPALV